MSPHRHVIRLLAAASAVTATTAVSLALVAPAAPAARPAIPRALDERTFDVDVKAIQRTTWTQNDREESSCGWTRQGSGAETVRLASRRAERLTFKRFGTSYVMLGDPTEVAGNETRANATVTRNGSSDFALVGDRSGCGDNGGMGPEYIPPARDCGTKKTFVDVGIEFLNEPRHGFSFDRGELGTLGELYRNCPWSASFGFPELLTEDRRGRAIVLPMTPDELFDRSFGQHILIGRGARTTNTPSAGLVTKTTVRWEIRLTRVGR
jgi:hypothetical protein